MINKLIFILVYLITYSVMGWIYESIYCSFKEGNIINRGFFYGPYCPIYGFAAIVDIIFLNKLSNPLEIFILGMIVSVILEYVTSYILEKIFNKRWWDYSEIPFNIKGRICLRATILFGIFAVILIKVIHPLIVGLIISFIINPKSILYLILPIILIDVILSINKNINIKEILKRYSI